MKKKPISEMTAAGSVASVPMSMNEEPVTRASPKKTAKKKQWRNSLHEAQVSEADLAEQDLIITRGMGKRLRPGLMPRQSSHEAVEMALGDLLQCRKNARTIEQIIQTTHTTEIEPWVSEKLVKASDYLNTVAEYMEGQRAGQDDSILTFEETKYSEDTYVIKRTYPDGTSDYNATRHTSEDEAIDAMKILKSKRSDCKYSIEKNPDIPGRTSVDEGRKKSRRKVQENPAVLGAVARTLGSIAGNYLGGRVADALSSPEKNMQESTLTRGANLLSRLKQAERENRGYTLVTESYRSELSAGAVRELLGNYRRAINRIDESAVVEVFGDADRLQHLLNAAGYIVETADISPEARERFHDLRRLSQADPQTRRQMLQRPEIRAAVLGPDLAGQQLAESSDMPASWAAKIKQHPELAQEITALWNSRSRSDVAEGRKPKRVPEEDKPYAFGMAAAKREAGIKTRGKPVPKKVVRKVHKIAKAIKKEEK